MSIEPVEVEMPKPTFSLDDPFKENSKTFEKKCTDFIVTIPNEDHQNIKSIYPILPKESKSK